MLCGVREDGWHSPVLSPTFHFSPDLPRLQSPDRPPGARTEAESLLERPGIHLRPRAAARLSLGAGHPGRLACSQLRPPFPAPGLGLLVYPSGRTRQQPHMLLDLTLNLMTVHTQV